MAVKIQFRRDTQTNWENTNPVLSQGEVGLDLTNDKFKIGNGIDAWNSLDYAFISDLASQAEAEAGTDNEKLMTPLRVEQYVTGQKGENNGLASLDGAGLVPSGQLPSYVDDVLEFADFASFPGTGETGKIYVDISENTTYRWTDNLSLDRKSICKYFKPY